MRQGELNAAMANRKLLSIYLNDHLAGAYVGRDLAKRTLSSNKDNEYGRALADVLRRIEDDRTALEDVMNRLGVRQNRPKQAFAWTLEKVGRLKFNGQIRGYSPLSRLAELEGLCLGVEGKLSLWRSLRTIAADEPGLASVDLERLIESAQSQREALEQLRLRAAEEALCG